MRVVGMLPPDALAKEAPFVIGHVAVPTWGKRADGGPLRICRVCRRALMVRGGQTIHKSGPTANHR